ncbi:MAG: HlyC/CorC family transporter [Alphaproteobacteria bacterium]|nr:HlyC/CorC family transporter [Alphaproteobacteria bacterium]
MSATIAVSVLTIVVFLLISAFFSAAETALTAVSRARIYQMIKEGNKRAVRVSRLRKEKESLIGTVLLANNAANIASSALATSLCIQLFGENSAELLIITLIMTFAVVIFAEILPKTYAIQNAEKTSLALAPSLSFMVKLLYPFTKGIRIFIRGLLKLFAVDISGNNTLISSADVLRGAVELHHREGTLVKQDRDMLGSILDLNDIEVRDIMVHRTYIAMIDASLSASDIREQAFSMMHSRIPLWKDNPDNIVGVLHVKDLIRAETTGRAPLDDHEILSLAHPPWFIPETTNLRDQLVAFRARRQHFAIVVDEYGAVLGIVTLEDIIEEIVGEIDDEHDDRGAKDIQKAGPNVYYIAGDVTIRDINRELDWDLSDEHASTLAGLVLYEARVIPAKGQHVETQGFRFTVVDKSATRIRRLRVEKLPAAENPAP